LGTSPCDTETVYQKDHTDDPFVITADRVGLKSLKGITTRRFVRNFEYAHDTNGFLIATGQKRWLDAVLDPLASVVLIKSNEYFIAKPLGEIQVAQLLCARNNHEWKKYDKIVSQTNLPKEISTIIFKYVTETFSSQREQIVPYILKKNIDEQMYQHIDKALETIEMEELVSIHLTDEAIKEHLRSVLLTFCWVDENGVETLWQRPISANFTWSNAK
jgi:hypothetical protein